MSIPTAELTTSRRFPALRFYYDHHDVFRSATVVTTVVSGRNEIETQFVVVRPLVAARRRTACLLPCPRARISLAKPSRDYANSGIIYFSFTLLLSFARRHRRPFYRRAQTSLYSRQRGRRLNLPTLKCRWVFDVATNCSPAMQNSESRIKREDKATNNRSILSEHTDR